jgi:hypothetical protein
MATEEQESRISLDGDKIIIDGLVIDNPEIVSFFQNLSESENLEQRLGKLLEIGIVVSKSINTTENISYVDKAFEHLNSNFTQKLETAFGDKGQFSEILKNHFGEDGSIIKELFNPNKEGSPLHLLKQELSGNLFEIREKLGINEAVGEEKEKGTQKGFDFEDWCETKLEWIAQIHSDKLERTSKKYGKIGKSLQGDFVITLGDVNKKIVFEMKNKTKISLKDIQKELKGAIANREADYGIFVAKNKDALPESIGWFNEYDGNHLVCAVENNDGEAIIDGEIIHIAYKWARAKLRLESSDEKRLDPAYIIEKTSEIQTKIGDMRKIKTQCTSIEKSTKEIRETAKDTEASIKKDLEEIIESLSDKQA